MCWPDHGTLPLLPPVQTKNASPAQSVSIQAESHYYHVYLPQTPLALLPATWCTPYHPHPEAPFLQLGHPDIQALLQLRVADIFDRFILRHPLTGNPCRDPSRGTNGDTSRGIPSTNTPGNISKIALAFLQPMQPSDTTRTPLG
jgi:hypothetical protein